MADVDIRRVAAVNPARAGMIPYHPESRPCDPGKPRASGDDPGFRKPRQNMQK